MSQSALTSYFQKKDASSCRDVVDSDDEARDTLSPPKKRVCERSSDNRDDVTDVPPSTTASSFDIGKLVDGSTRINAETRRQWIDACLRPPDGYSFPPRNGRSCLPTWFGRFKWLRYSPSLNGCFCLPCVLFGKSNSSRGQLVSTPLTNFHKGASALSRHDEQKSHHVSLADFSHFLTVKDRQMSSVDAQLRSVDAERCERNRSKLVAIVNAILYLGRQNIALRGHREPSTAGLDIATMTVDSNPGNFLALLNLMATNGCSELSQQFDMPLGGRPCSYYSPQIQNDIIDCIGEVIRGDIISAVRKAKFFALCADEASDVSNFEQMPVVVRYVTTENTVDEDFLGFVKCDLTSGRALAAELTEFVTSAGLDMALLRGQGYDGAGNMAGKYNGVAAVIKENYPKAHYCHCASHVLNLCIVNACNVPAVTQMWADMTELSLFFYGSPKRYHALSEAIHEHAPASAKTKLVSLCKTRWVARHDALSTFEELYRPVLECLRSIAENENGTWTAKSVSQANGLLTRLERFDFHFSFVVMKKALSHVKSLTVNLQKRAADVNSAYQHVTGVTKTLQGLRDKADETHKAWYSQAKQLAESVGSEPCLPRFARRMLDQSETTEQYYRRTVFIPFLDALLFHLNTRFAPLQSTVQTGFSVVPSLVRKSKASPASMAEALCKEHGDDLPGGRDEVEAECEQWALQWRQDQLQDKEIPQSSLEALDIEPVRSGMFPNIQTALQLNATLPVVAAECERNISALRRLKNFMRNTTGQDRLSSLALMHIHYGQPVDIQKVVDIFASRHPRRMALTNLLHDAN